MFFPSIRTPEFEYLRSYLGFSGHNYDIPYSSINFSKDFKEVVNQLKSIQERYYSKAIKSITVSKEESKMCFWDVSCSSEEG